MNLLNLFFCFYMYISKSIDEPRFHTNTFTQSIFFLPRTKLIKRPYILSKMLPRETNYFIFRYMDKVAKPSACAAATCDLPYPSAYITHHLAEGENITVDGKLDDPAWENVPWAQYRGQHQFL